VTEPPIVVDFYCGLGGWTEAFLAEGYDAIGFDNERHNYGSGGYPGQLILQDVCTIHGAQLAPLLPRLAVLVASSPCQEFSYRAMPWKRAKALGPPHLGIRLFWQAFRIQQELYEATGVYVPLIAENVRGAEKWVGPARWHFGSYYLWGDVPPLMPIPAKAQKFNPDGTAHGQGSWFKIADSVNRGAKVPGFRFDGSGRSFQTASVEGQKVGVYSDPRRNGGKGKHLTNPRENLEGIKQHGSGPEWFDNGIAKHSSKSDSRKAASAQIAKIPLPLAQWVAKCFKPDLTEQEVTIQVLT
jgi:hypothetical protein